MYSKSWFEWDVEHLVFGAQNVLRTCCTPSVEWLPRLLCPTSCLLTGSFSHLQATLCLHYSEVFHHPQPVHGAALQRYHHHLHRGHGDRGGGGGGGDEGDGGVDGYADGGDDDYLVIVTTMVRMVMMMMMMMEMCG